MRVRRAVCLHTFLALAFENALSMRVWILYMHRFSFSTHIRKIRIMRSLDGCIMRRIYPGEKIAYAEICHFFNVHVFRYYGNSTGALAELMREYGVSYGDCWLTLWILFSGA